MHPYIESNITAYLNGTASFIARIMIRIWLNIHQQSRSQYKETNLLAKAIRSQPEVPPTPTLLAQIHSRTEPRTKSLSFKSKHSRLLLPISIGLGILAAILLWQAFPPVNSLEWSVNGELPEAFRIYRASISEDHTNSRNNLVLLDEIEASNLVRDYQYTDYLLLPGGNILYRIEAIDRFGNETGVSELVVSSYHLLPSYLFGLSAIAIIFLGTWLALHWLRNKIIWLIPYLQQGI